MTRLKNQDLKQLHEACAAIFAPAGASLCTAPLPYGASKKLKLIAQIAR